MEKITARLTVYFEDPFWVGVYERTEKEKLEAARVVFGPEPKSYQVYEYFSRNFNRLKFSPPLDHLDHSREKINPKRLQRQIKRQLEKAGSEKGSKSQQALKLLKEQSGQERKKHRKKQKEEEEKKRFALKQQKKKQKHRGH